MDDCQAELVEALVGEQSLIVIYIGADCFRQAQADMRIIPVKINFSYVMRELINKL